LYISRSLVEIKKVRWSTPLKFNLLFLNLTAVRFIVEKNDTVSGFPALKKTAGMKQIS